MDSVLQVESAKNQPNICIKGLHQVTLQKLRAAIMDAK
jgi:response regulator of citrate/malate metabolism